VSGPQNFSTQDYSVRHQYLGDTAEAVFEERWPANWVRFGLSRPPLSMGMLPPKVRYQPDYLTSNAFYEVMACGRDRTLKLKVDKLDVLKFYHEEIFNTLLFVWHMTDDRYGAWTIEDVGRVAAGTEIKEFKSDRKPYYPIDIDLLPDEGWASGGS